MLDRLRERMLREPPEERAKAQIRDLSANTRKTLKALDKHLNDHLTSDILHTHKVREAEIRRRGRKPPPDLRPVCRKPLPGPPSNFWTNEPGLKLAWTIVATVIFLRYAANANLAGEDSKL